MVGIRLIVEVLDRAPAELAPQERLLLVVLAEAAADETRECWPGMETLTHRVGLWARRVREVLADLGQRGYKVRVPSGVDKHGMPVFASKGHRTVYRVPTFPQRRRDLAPLKAAGFRPLSDSKAAESGIQRRRDPAPLSLKNPQKNPQVKGHRPTTSSRQSCARFTSGPGEASTATTPPESSSSSSATATASATGWPISSALSPGIPSPRVSCRRRARRRTEGSRRDRPAAARGDPCRHWWAQTTAAAADSPGRQTRRRAAAGAA